MRTTKFSEFIRNASADEKSAVYTDVMQKASLSQTNQETIALLNELIRLFGEMQAILDKATERHEAANERI